MAPQLDSFIAENDGNIVDVDKAFAGQCVDLVDLWAQRLGAPLPLVRSAKDFAGMSIQGYTWIANTATNVPSPGDIVVWDERVGDENGHTAIFIEGDIRSFTSFDQNFPRPGTPCSRQFHHYTEGVQGWQRFTVSTASTGVLTTFKGTVSADGGAHVRTLPGTENAIVLQPGANPEVVDKGTLLTFDGWTRHGPAIPDAISGHGDDRWFRTTQGHWIASAMIVGNPPPGMDPVPDPNA